MIKLGVHLFFLILIGISWASWIWGLVSFISFEILTQFLSLPHSFCLFFLCGNRIILVGLVRSIPHVSNSSLYFPFLCLTVLHSILVSEILVFQCGNYLYATETQKRIVILIITSKQSPFLFLCILRKSGTFSPFIIWSDFQAPQWRNIVCFINRDSSGTLVI